ASKIQKLNYSPRIMIISLKNFLAAASRFGLVYLILSDLTFFFCFPSCVVGIAKVGIFSDLPNLF
ncbi:hypothetical protein, partial [Sphingobacterium chungjuense]|uniref:hypothetical protein n=1 Tax=Sphingobacterium chungjuense TaxID=2675553 RepID=UPI0019D046D6